MLGKIKSTKIGHVTKYRRFSGADTGLLEMVVFLDVGGGGGGGGYGNSIYGKGLIGLTLHVHYGVSVYNIGVVPSFRFYYIKDVHQPRPPKKGKKR